MIASRVIFSSDAAVGCVNWRAFASASFVSMSPASSASVLGRWMEQREYNFPEDYWDTYPAKVMAVKPEDVQRVAKKYVPVDNAQIIAVGDAKIAELLKKFGSVEEKSPDMN